MAHNCKVCGFQFPQETAIANDDRCFDCRSLGLWPPRIAQGLTMAATNH